MRLALTDAGRAALVDPDNTGLSAVRFTRLQIGSGGVDGGSTNRAALRTPGDAAAAAGSAGGLVPGLALSSTIPATSAYSVNEVGLWAAVGAGAEFLAGYFGQAAALARTVSGVPIVVTVSVQITDAAADVVVTVSPSITVIGASRYLALLDTPAAFGGAGGIARVNAASNGIEHVDPGIVGDLIGVARPTPAATEVYGVQVTAAGVVSLVRPFEALQDTRGPRIGSQPVTAVLLTNAKSKIRVRADVTRSINAGRVDVDAAGAVQQIVQVTSPSADALDMTSAALPAGLYVVAITTSQGVIPPGTNLRATAVA